MKFARFCRNPLLVLAPHLFLCHTASRIHLQRTGKRLASSSQVDFLTLSEQNSRVKFPWTRRRDVARFQLALLGFKPEAGKRYLVRWYQEQPEYYWNDIFDDAWKREDWTTCYLVLKARYGSDYVSSLKLTPSLICHPTKKIPNYLAWELLFHNKFELFGYLLVRFLLVLYMIVIYIMVTNQEMK